MNVVSYLGQGIFHEQQGTPCQDAVSVRAHPNGNWVIALSDGASEAKYAEEAASATVKSVQDFFCRQTLADFLSMDEFGRKEALLSAIRGRLRENAYYISREAAEFSATLAFSVTDGVRVLTGHLGDGAIYAVGYDGEVVFASEPDNASASHTWFAVSSDAAEHLRLHVLDAQSVSCVILLSDGPYPMFRNRGGGSVAATVQELSGFLRDGTVRTNDDLRGILNQMVYVPSERMDDWSLAAWTAEQEPGTPAARNPQTAVSMLQEEEAKHGGDME